MPPSSVVAKSVIQKTAFLILDAPMGHYDYWVPHLLERVDLDCLALFVRSVFYSCSGSPL